MFLDMLIIITTIIKGSPEIHRVPMNILCIFLASVKKDKESEKEVMLSLDPSLKTLVANQLLKHANKGVQITVLYIIHEPLRIKTPDKAYKDKKMNILEFLKVFCSLFDKI